MWRAVSAVLTLALAACSTPPTHGALPPDVEDPDAVVVLETPHFRLFADHGCLSEAGLREVEAELSHARAWVVERFGPALSPGNFRPLGVPRTSPPNLLGPPPEIAPIDVVITDRGTRCHADEDGITVLLGHLPRRDATHELIHFLWGTAWRPIDEGLAVYLTEELWGPDKDFPLTIRARVYLELGMGTHLDPLELRSQGMNRRDYDVAGAFVGWLLDTYGDEPFASLYSGPEGSFEAAYGVEARVLYERFWDHVRRLRVRHDPAYLGFRRLLTRE